MKIEIRIPKAGLADQSQSVQIHVASLLYDLWEDYIQYRHEAEAVDKQSEPLRYKRLVRAAVHSYFGYFEGVLNAWIAKINPRVDLEEVSFRRKLGLVRERVGNSTRVPYLDVEWARDIRNTIVHLMPTQHDLDIMARLLDGQFFRDADQFTNWLNLASLALKMERHPDVLQTMQQLRENFAVQALAPTE